MTKTQIEAATTPAQLPPATANIPRKVAARMPPQKAAAKPSGKQAVRTTRSAPQATKPQKVAKPAKVKPKKMRLIRDSFTMPEAEHALIAALKERCLAIGVAARKSEILRAAIAVLADLDDKAVAIAIRRVEVIKTGRPAKTKK
ncbi:MAG: hypothetical protein D4S02_01345 [Rhodocyclaceae bacterium]|nr:MAG: hypothetical protein D4S02_01345 [Rhodocyclaceae bacterium]